MHVILFLTNGFVEIRFFHWACSETIFLRGFFILSSMSALLLYPACFSMSYQSKIISLSSSMSYSCSYENLSCSSEQYFCHLCHRLFFGIFIFICLSKWLLSIKQRYIKAKVQYNWKFDQNPSIVTCCERYMFLECSTNSQWFHAAQNKYAIAKEGFIYWVAL